MRRIHLLVLVLLGVLVFTHSLMAQSKNDVLLKDETISEFAVPIKVFDPIIEKRVVQIMASTSVSMEKAVEIDHQDSKNKEITDRLDTIIKLLFSINSNLYKLLNE